MEFLNTERKTETQTNAKSSLSLSPPSLSPLFSPPPSLSLKKNVKLESEQLCPFLRKAKAISFFL